MKLALAGRRVMRFGSLGRIPSRSAIILRSSAGDAAPTHNNHHDSMANIPIQVKTDNGINRRVVPRKPTRTADSVIGVYIRLFASELCEALYQLPPPHHWHQYYLLSPASKCFQLARRTPCQYCSRSCIWSFVTGKK